MNVDDAVLSALVGRRMVLLLPCGDGGLAQRLAALGVPTVGLDPDQDRVDASRARRQWAWPGSWSLLRHQRGKFDGMLVAAALLGTGAERAAALTVLAASLLPGGVALLPGADPESLRDATPPDCELRVGAEGVTALVRRRAEPAAGGSGARSRAARAWW